MPSMTLQLLNRTSTNSRNDNTVFFMIATLVIIDLSIAIILFQIAYHMTSDPLSDKLPGIFREILFLP
jgi:hypothetical protein